MPKVTIGMPLYNEAEIVETAIGSLLAQTFTDFQLRISDNCSQDETPEICKRLAATDPRISYYRQPTNLNYGNFRYLLRGVDTPYFMWAAGDDWWAPTFIEKNLAVLEADPGIVGSVSKVQFMAGETPAGLSNGTFPLLGDVATNLEVYISTLPNDCSRLYGLFRTEVLQKSFPSEDHHAYDWTVCAATLRYGKHFELDEVLMRRDRTPPGAYAPMVRKDHHTVLGRAFPVARMSRYLLFKEKLPLTWRLAAALFAVNIDKHFEYMNSFHPLYKKCTKPVQKLWRHRLRPKLRYRPKVDTGGIEAASVNHTPATPIGDRHR